MAVLVDTEPAIEPVGVDEFKAHIRLDTTDPEPAPSACSAALASPAAAGNVEAGTHRYKYTFVTSDGETDGSPATSAVTVADASVNGQVSVSNISIGSSLVVSRKLYRTKAGASTYYYLATISNNTASTYTDNVADASLGAELHSVNTTADGYLQNIIKAARRYVENYTGLSLITRTLVAYLDCVDGNCIRLPYGPVQSVDLIQYKNQAGTLQTWDSSNYQVDVVSPIARIVPQFGITWPVYGPYIQAVQVEYTAGYGDAAADVPDDLRQFIKIYAAHLFEHRQPVAAVQGIVVVPIPQLDVLMTPYVCYDSRVEACL